MEQPKEYYAFISYKREDEKWAKWLANELEHYNLPTTMNGKNLPKTLRPIFRDVDELSAGNLPKQIYQALSNSKNLIVVCSPRAAKSEWVDKEISDFIKIKGGKTDNIYPFIIEGVPFSKDSTYECFPETLRNLPGNEERLGGNINEAGGKDVAVVKTIAGMLGVSHDSLWNRYEREQRKKRLFLIGLFIIVLVIVLGIAGYMWSQNKQLKINQARFIVEKATLLLDDGNSYLARRLLLEVTKDGYPYLPEVESVFRRAIKAKTIEYKLENGSFVKSKMSFGADGKWLMMLLNYNNLVLYNINNGRIINRSNVAMDADAASFIDGGKKILLGSHYGLVTWDIEDLMNWKRKNIDNVKGDTLHTGNGTVRGAKYAIKYYNPYNNYQKIIIWNVDKKVTVDTLDQNNCNDFELFPDGKTLATISFSNNCAYLWNYIKKECLDSVQNIQKILDISNNSRYMLLSNDYKNLGNSRLLYVYDCINKTKDTLRCYAANIAAFSYNSKQIAVISSDSLLLLERMKNGKYEPLRVLDIDERYMDPFCDNISFSPDGSKIAIKTPGNYNSSSVKIIDIARDETYTPLELHEIVEDLVVSPDDKFIYYTSSGYITRVDLNNKKNEKIYKYDSSAKFDGMELSSDGNRLLFSTKNYQNIKSVQCVLDVNTKKRLFYKEETDLQYFPRWIKMSSDGKRVAFPAADKICIFDIETRKCLKQIKNVYVMGINNNLNLIALPNDSSVGIYNFKQQSEICKLERDKISSIYNSIHFSPNGQIIAVLNNNSKSVILKNLISGKEIILQGGNEKLTDNLIFCPDNSRILAYSRYGISIWDVTKGIILDSCSFVEGGITSVGFNSTANKAYFVKNGNVFVWEIPSFSTLLKQERERFKDSPLTPDERRIYYLE